MSQSRRAGWVILLIAVAGCRDSAAEAPNAAGPPTVTVAYPLERKLVDYAVYTGRAAAVDAVQVRARVSGYLDKIHFKDGSEVKEGAVLYEIDPRPYQAAFDQAEAQVKLQKANLKYQEAVYKRDVWLFGQKALAEQDLEQQLEARNTASAQVKAAQAALETARLNLDWTKVTAPISGRLSRTLITRGNLVTADQSVLTTIVTEDPVFVYFDVDERTVLHVQGLIREGKFGKTTPHGVGWPVRVGLATDQGFPHAGTVDFSNNQFNPGTATLQVRAKVANPEPPFGRRLFAPGAFAGVRVPISPLHPALLVVQGAVGQQQDRNFLFVIDSQDRVVRNDVTLGTARGGLQAIASGITANDRVVINGIQRVKAGMVVHPKLVPMPVPRPDEFDEMAK
jgi:RND family efflux transporter MFP subunit